MYVDGKRTMVSMHRFLHAHDATWPLDHINRNKADNRSDNIRCGANGTNDRNRILKREGVDTLASEFCEYARWTNLDGSRDGKRFYWADYGSSTAARSAAIAYRREQADPILEKLVQAQVENGGKPVAVARRVRPKKKPSSTGIRNLNYALSQTALLAVLKINGKRFSRYWTISHYANQEDAIEVAKTWIAQTRAENPKISRRDKVKLVV